VTDGRLAGSRTRLLVGTEGWERLRRSCVAVVGLGGVGAFAAEALARAGVGRLRLVDCDVIRPTDFNRHLFAVEETLGMPKVEAAGRRLRSVAPGIELDLREAFFHADTRDELLGGDISFVIDAIDSLAPKVELLCACVEKGLPVISAMGSAGRTDPMAVRIGGIRDTAGDPLARHVRRGLRRRGVTADIPVVFSVEKMGTPSGKAGDREGGEHYRRGRERRVLPSLPSLPGIFGLCAANVVILKLSGCNPGPREPGGPAPQGPNPGL
jgi:tRNA A37 threonylcarbamoyladenosine dehydratase